METDLAYAAYALCTYYILLPREPQYTLILYNIAEVLALIKKCTLSSRGLNIMIQVIIIP